MGKLFGLLLGGLAFFAAGANSALADGYYHYSGGMQNYYPRHFSFGKCYGYIGQYSPLDKQFTTPAPYYTPAQQYYGYPYFWQQQQSGAGTSNQAPTAGYHYYPAMPNTMMPTYWYGR